MLDKRKGVYPGSFDPIHNGHIKTAEHMLAVGEVEQLTIGIGKNPDKTNSSTFHHQERAAMIKDALLDLPKDIAEKISVDFVQGLIVDYCQKKGIKYILKTYRNPADLREESAQEYYNSIINSDVATKLIEANFANSLPHVSSSGEKILTKLQGNQKGVHTTLRVKHALETRINQQYIVGMTGEIGSGKSYVGEKFVQVGEKFGIPTYNIDFDSLGHNILKKSNDYQHVRDEIKNAFGEQCINSDGSIHRGNLGGIVFNPKNTEELKKLNKIMKEPLQTELRGVLSGKTGLLIFNNALLAEHDSGNLVNNNIVSINVDRLEQIKRLVARENNPVNLAKRDGKEFTAQDAEDRIKLKWDTQQKEAYFYQVQRLKRFGDTVKFDNTSPSEQGFVKSYIDTLNIVDTDLSLRFTSIYKKLGLTGNAQQLFKDIYFRYLNNDLPYHNWEHIKAGINMIYQHRDDLNNPELVAMARFFHDAIYNTMPPVAGGKNNERLSAELAQNTLIAHGMAAHDAWKIRQLILATEHKTPYTHDIDQQYLMDIDMSILPSDKETYDKYAKAIRMEYAQYPDAIYNPGRIQLLEGFLEKPIFHSKAFTHLEEKAKANLKREIYSLKKNIAL